MPHYFFQAHAITVQLDFMFFVTVIHGERIVRIYVITCVVAAINMENVSIAEMGFGSKIMKTCETRHVRPATVTRVFAILC